MTAHHHGDINAFERQIVEIGAGEALRDKARSRRIARRVVEADEIVVDRLGDVHGAKPMVGFFASSATMRTVSEESLPPM